MGKVQWLVVLTSGYGLWAAAAFGCGAPAESQVSAGLKSEALVEAPVEWGRSGAPPEVRAARREWPLTNRDYAGTRATFDSKLGSANVTQLTAAWSRPLSLPGGAFGSATGAPLVLHGIVYYADMLSNVTAVDLETGKLIWEKRYDTQSLGPNGIAVGWGKLFAIASPRSFVALDLATGEELWRAPIELPPNAAYGIAPLVYDQKVYLSSVPVNASAQYFGGVNGTLYALDQANGKVVWSFATIEDSTLWGHPDINGGGGAWYPPTVDEERGITYWGIGNPVPWPGTADFPLGSSRPGPNLYTNSVVSLDARSGGLHWYHQEAPHDLFDLDFQNPPIIATASPGGVKRRLVIGSGKTGTVVALDPKDGGKVVWRTAVGRHEYDTLQSIGPNGVVVYPGRVGGIVTPAAYARSTVYVPAVNWGTRYYPDHFDDTFATESSTGQLVALDASDGGLRWTAELSAGLFGSVTVVNDLVLTPTFDGKVHAFDSASGNELWTWQAPGAINAPISVADDTLLIPVGIGDKPQLIALRLP
jgi:glucose dehydrogenase